MSLVRDFTELVEGGTTCAAFDRVFSLEPRPLDPPHRRELPLTERYLVVPADDSQVAAVARAREGESFVIQGPPGTGKSQTITNLVADYVARGRRVLFVCQKRAAIDVVHARLRQQGLDELTCLIHDSQADKKAFVHGLRDTYEAWTAARRPRPRAGRAGPPGGRRGDRRRAVPGARLRGRRRRPDGRRRARRPRQLLERLVDLRRAGLAGRRAAGGPRGCSRRRPPGGRPARSSTGSPRRSPSTGAEPVLATSPGRFLAPGVLAAARPDAEVAVRGPRAARPSATCSPRSTRSPARRRRTASPGRTTPAPRRSGSARRSPPRRSAGSCCRSPSAAGPPRCGPGRRPPSRCAPTPPPFGRRPRGRADRGPGRRRVARAARPGRRPRRAEDRPGQGGLLPQGPQRCVATGKRHGAQPVRRRAGGPCR